MSEKKVEEIADRQAHARTVREYSSGTSKCIREDYKGKWVEVSTTRKSGWIVPVDDGLVKTLPTKPYPIDGWVRVFPKRKDGVYTERFCFDEKDFSDKVDENILVGRISKSTFNIGPDCDGHIYVFYSDEGFKTTVYAYPPVCKIREG